MSDLDQIIPEWSARDIALDALDVVLVAVWRHHGWQQPLMNLAWTLHYADWRIEHGSRGGKRRKLVEDIEGLTARWHAAIVAMSTGHGHEQFTAAEHSTDELLGPLLTAPIAQLRLFASTLATRLEADERVPFLVWSTFKRVITPLILKRPEGAVVRLKTALAQEVAELVEQDIPRADLIAAIAGALAWRSTEALEQTKAAIQQGAKPRMTGRQSCLFLVTELDGKELSNVIL